VKLPEAATKGFKEQAPRGRQYAVTRLLHCGGTAVAVLSNRRHDTLTPAVQEAEAIDHRLNPTIVLVEKEDT
jgi:hypothetical protein